MRTEVVISLISIDSAEMIQYFPLTFAENIPDLNKAVGKQFPELMLNAIVIAYLSIYRQPRLTLKLSTFRKNQYLI